LTTLARGAVAQGYAALRAQGDALLDGRHPFHWPLEFPEIFGGDLAPAVNWDSTDAILHAECQPARCGFDAIIGNPPFQGGQRITGALGTDYRDYLLDVLASGKRGSADLCAYFFLRGYSLLTEGGDLSLLATNTIAQGDTREVGVDQLLANGATILRAEPSRKWPGEANLEIAEIWLRRGSWQGGYVLRDQPVSSITAFLTPPGAVEGKPYRLRANERKSFQGSIVLGMGFVLEPEEAKKLIAHDPRNREVLFPYLNGEDLNSRPDQSPSRWVINFHDWSLERAETYPDCMAIVRGKVKPERDKNNRAQRRERWWQYGERAPALYATIAGMDRVLVLCIVTHHVGFAFVPADQVFAHRLVVFPLSEWGAYALLQSNQHEPWARDYSSQLETRLNYSPSDCFETFPFPPSTIGLDDIGERYNTHRQSIMLARQEGLTTTYNRFHDPRERADDITTLRRLHVEMDQAVAAAYGWTDLDLGHGFHQTKQGVRFTISEPARRELLGRLLTLNHERYAEEVRQGLHTEKGAKKASKRATRAGAAAQMSLMADTDPVMREST
jgi:hypothetical protein